MYQGWQKGKAMKMLVQQHIVLFLSALLFCACTGDRHDRLHADTVSTAVQLKGSDTSPAVLLIPATARVDHVADLVRDPEHDSVSDDPHLAEQIRLGYRLIRETGTYAQRYVGNALTCGNCHLNAGQRDGALPYVGIAGAFPEYRSRSGRLISLEDRIRGCFVRSMNGTAPPFDSPELLAISAYITWLSQGIPVGADPVWRGKNRIAKDSLIPIGKLDVERGGRLFMQKCITCHGIDGQGVDIAIAKPAPLWGPQSWNDGAGLARVYALAGFIRYAMPLTNPGSLTDEEAQNISAFINSKERPIFAHKEKDYPHGDVPVDAVYYPIYRRNPLMP